MRKCNVETNVMVNSTLMLPDRIYNLLKEFFLMI